MPARWDRSPVPRRWPERGPVVAGLTGSAVHPGQRHRTAPRPAPGVLAARGPPCFGPGTRAWGQSGFPSWPLSELSRRPASASLCVAVKDCFPIPKKEGEAHVTALTNSCRPGQSPRHFSLLGWDPAFVTLATSACRRGAWSREGASGPPWTPAEETQPEAGVVSAGRPRSRCRGACVLLLPCSALPPWLSPSRLRSRVGPDSGATVEGPADVARRPPLAPPPGQKPPVTPPSFPSPGPRPHRQSSAGGLCVSAGFRYYS